MEDMKQEVLSACKSAAELRAVRSSENSSAAEALNALFDEGTFVEIGTYAHKISAELGGNENELESVICGYGAIDGRLVFAFAQDYSRMKGALGAMHAKKICDLYDLALRNASPIIGVFNSAGAYVMEGVEALAGYGKMMKKVSEASGMIPQIALVTGPCGGAAAVIAEMFDFVIGAEKTGSLYVNPPFVLGKEDNMEFAAEDGRLSLLCDDEASAIASARSLLSYLPQNNGDGTVVDLSSDEINRLTPDVQTIVSADGYAVRDVIKAISDNAAYFELNEKWGEPMSIGFAKLNGRVIGVIANDPSVKEGRICACAAKKAARFLSFCDAFDIPVLTLVDTAGYMVAAECEKKGYAAALGKLASAYASSENAKVTVILGKAYGAAYTLMGSKAIGADIVFASENAKISALPTASAVAFAWNDKVTDNAKRGEIEKEWDSVMASPVAAAKAGEVDDIISLDELRQRTAAAFEMLSAKNAYVCEKRHNNLPL